MNKYFTLLAMLVGVISPVTLANVSTLSPQKPMEIKPSKTQVFSLIVKFNDNKIHQSLLSTPETTRVLERYVKAQKSSESSSAESRQSIQQFIADFKEKYNLTSNVSPELGSQTLMRLKQKYNVSFNHVRSMALGSDLIRVTAQSPVAVQQLIQLMLKSGDFKHVELDTQVSQQSFNDPYFEEQKQLYAYSKVNLYGQDFLSMREQVVNNLGRNIRIGIVDSGSAKHEDITDRVEGYDFLVTYDDERLLTDEERDDNPDDVSILEDESLCHNGHGLSVASLIAATSNNGLGIVGAMDSTQVDLVYARVLDCFGSGNNSGILDAVAWMSGENVPGVPDISQKVDVMNLSLGGAGVCNSSTQAVYDKARENGVVVLVAAGNEYTDAKEISPASCNNIITVGATDMSGDKASFSNFGDYVDIMSAGESVWMLRSDEFIEQQSLYFQGSGTSMATPNAAAGVGNLLLKYPELTPAEVEAMMKANGTPYVDSSLCGQLGCGAGAVNMGKLMSALESVTTNKTYSKEHRYQGYDNEAQTSWLNEMDNYMNTCDLLKYTWGALGHARENIEYKLYKVTEEESIEFEKTATPQKVITQLVDAELGVQSCENDVCGDIVVMSQGNLIKPLSCQ